MRALLQKELTLAVHPTNLIFLGLSALALIPNYPYETLFFYNCLGVFFLCLTARENRDVEFTLLLPVPKRAAVAARMLAAALLQLAQAGLAVPFALVRNWMPMENQVGLEANVAFFGVAFLLLGAFNLVFFPLYYRDVGRVGLPFLAGCAVFTLLTCAAEASAHLVPFVRDVLDTKDPAHLPQKLAVLGIGLAAYALCTLLAYLRSARSFERLDL